jgi:hypothetical protein
VCGEIGFPGDEDVETEVPGIIGGTAESWREDELDDLCRSNEDERESDRAAFDSRIRWYLESAAVVLRIEASREAESARLKLFRSFFCSKRLMKSLRLSSSVCGIEPALPPWGSFRTSDPCLAEDEALALPLLLLSSSPLLPPPEENRLLRWLKLLLYLLIGAGFGELDAEEAIAVSFGSTGARKAA